MAEVAKAVGVSKNTVSLALRGSPRVLAQTRALITQKAEEMGYRLNPTVAHLMAHLRQTRVPRYQATLAIMNAYKKPDAFTKHATIPSYVEGCRRRASQLGYQLDAFWLYEPDMSVARWRSIFLSRNIRGIIVVGLMQNNRLPAHMSQLWDEFPAVVTGVRTRAPALSFACSDHHALALEAFERAIRLGYRRPALVLDRVIDDLTEGRFTAGFLTGQSRLVSDAQKTLPFYDVAAARVDPVVFSNWVKENQPDVIFTLYHEVKRWVLDLGLRIPEDLGLIQYEWRADHADWSGMDQRNDLVGEAAVDMIISMVHHNQRGIPPQALATMIGPRWVDGYTSRRDAISG